MGQNETSRALIGAPTAARPRTHASPAITALIAACTFILGVCAAAGGSTATPERSDPAPATAPTTDKACTAQDFATAVDEAGSRLRAFNESSLPRLKSRLRQLKTARGWRNQDYEQRAMDQIHDARIASFDRQASDLLFELDRLGREGDNPDPDCTKLASLEASASELLAVMKTRTAYMLDKLDAEISGTGKAPPTATTARLSDPGPGADRKVDPFLPPPARTGKQQAASPPEPGLPQAAPKTTKADARATKTATATATATKPRPEPGQRPPSIAAIEDAPPPTAAPEDWSVETTRSPQQPLPSPELPPASAHDTLAALQRDEAAEPPPTTAAGYTINEIRNATRGFFGNVSANLASVIEYAFETWGRPTSYILGEEGGGAVLAGLRYGNGTLYTRDGTSRKLYWHGPSVGYDFGATGSRTLFLIYRMNEPDQLLRAFTGLDGSAYLVGGVGLTIMKGGPVIIAPIRSGLGLRLGANIGYLRFTDRPTWNPF